MADADLECCNCGKRGQRQADYLRKKCDVKSANAQRWACDRLLCADEKLSLVQRCWSAARRLVVISLSFGR